MATRKYFILEDGKIKLIGEGGDCVELQNLAQEATLNDVSDKLGLLSDAPTEFSVLWRLKEVQTQLQNLNDGLYDGNDSILANIADNLVSLIDDFNAEDFATETTLQAANVLLQNIQNGIDNLEVSVAIDFTPVTDILDLIKTALDVFKDAFDTQTEETQLLIEEVKDSVDAFKVSFDDRDLASETTLVQVANTLLGIDANRDDLLYYNADPLAPSGVDSTGWIDTLKYPDFYFFWYAYVEPASVVQTWSEDGVNPLNDPDTGKPSALAIQARTAEASGGAWIVNVRPSRPKLARWVKFDITNGTTDQTGTAPVGTLPDTETFFWGMAQPYNGTYVGVNDGISNLSSLHLTRSVLSAVKDNGIFDNIGATNAGNLKSAIAEFTGEGKHSAAAVPSTPFKSVPTEVPQDSYRIRFDRAVIDEVMDTSESTAGGNVQKVGVLGEFSVDDTPNAKAVARTFDTIEYDPAHGFFMDFTSVEVEDDSDDESGWYMGGLTSTNGFGIGRGPLSKNPNLELGIVHRYNGFDLFIPQSQWNVDKCDGSQGSGFVTRDSQTGEETPIPMTPENGRVWSIVSGYLGFSSTAFFVKPPGALHYILVHILVHNSPLTTVTNPDLPGAVEVFNGPDVQAGQGITIRSGSMRGGSYKAREESQVSTQNSRYGEMAANTTFTGAGAEVKGYDQVEVTILADNQSAEDGMIFQATNGDNIWFDITPRFSHNGVNEGRKSDDGTLGARTFQLNTGGYQRFRTKYVQGDTTGEVNITTTLVPRITLTSLHRLGDDTGADRSVLVNKSAIIAAVSDADLNLDTKNSIFKSIGQTPDGGLITSNPWRTVFRTNASENGTLPTGATPAFNKIGPIVAPNVLDSGWINVTRFKDAFTHLIANVSGLKLFVMNASDDQGNDSTTINFAFPTGTTIAGFPIDVGAPMFQDWARIIVINDSGEAADNWAIRFQGADNPPGPVYQSIDQPIFSFYPAPLVQSVSKAEDPDGNIESINKDGRHSANSTISPLNGDTGGIDHIWRGEWFEWQGRYVGMVNEMISDVSGTMYIDFSTNASPVNGDETGVTWSLPIEFDPAQGLGVIRRHTPTQSRWVRLRYVNGPIAQFNFAIDTSFITSPSPDVLETLDVVPSRNELAGIERVKTFAEDDVGEHGFIGRGGAGKGLDVHVTGNDAKQRLSGLANVQQVPFVLTAESQRIDVPALSGTRAVEVVNSGEFHVFVKEDDTVSENSRPLFIGGSATYLLEEGEELHGICEDTGGSSQDVVEDGTIAAGTATDTNNALVSNNSRAIQDAIGETIQISGFNFAFDPGFDSIERLRIGWQGRKSLTPATKTVSVEETQVGSAAGATSIVSAALSGGTQQCYLVSVSRNDLNTVASVSGAGLTFNPIVQNISSGGRHQDLWIGVGDATAGAITAAMSSSTSGQIAVTRLSGVDQENPVQQSLNQTGASTSATTSALDVTALGLVYTMTGHEATTGSSPAGYTELSDETVGTGVNRVTLGTQYKPIVTTGTEVPTYNLGTSTDWAMISVSLAPAETDDPTIEISYELDGVPGVTTAIHTIAGTTDHFQYVDITPDFGGNITVGDIALLEIFSEVATIGGAAVETDHLFLEIRESSGAQSLIVVTQGQVQ